jgi:hypothetical protein
MHAVRIHGLRRAIDGNWQRLEVWEMRERERKCGGMREREGGRWLWRERGRSWAGAPQEPSGLHLSSGKRREGGNGLGVPGWAEAEMFAGLDLLPEALFQIRIIFFFSFLFFSDLLFNFCTLAPI